MKRIRWPHKAALALALFAAVALLFRGPLFRAVVEYRTETLLSDRPRFLSNAAAVAEARQAYTRSRPSSLQDLMELADDLTTRRLHFRLSGGTTDPDKAAALGASNCLGYAALFAAFFNELLEVSGKTALYRAEHVRGRTALFGVLLEVNVFGIHLRNHDFNIVSEQRDGGWVPVYYLDTGVSDLAGILRVRGRR